VVGQAVDSVYICDLTQIMNLDALWWGGRVASTSGGNADSRHELIRIGRVREDAQELVREFPEAWMHKPPDIFLNLAEGQISGGPKAGAMPVKDYNACTIENNTRPP